MHLGERPERGVARARVEERRGEGDVAMQERRGAGLRARRAQLARARALPQQARDHGVLFRHEARVCLARRRVRRRDQVAPVPAGDLQPQERERPGVEDAGEPRGERQVRVLGDRPHLGEHAAEAQRGERVGDRVLRRELEVDAAHGDAARARHVRDRGVARPVGREEPLGGGEDLGAAIDRGHPVNGSRNHSNADGRSAQAPLVRAGPPLDATRR